MKMKAFEPVSIAYPNRIGGKDPNYATPLSPGIGQNKEYSDFLAQDGKTIRIRKIDNFPGNECSLVYYDELYQPAVKLEVEDRFNDLDI